ncbi:DNA repair protein RecN [Alkalibaculum sp. M08DMB]|uniref:DNA repair protein RecN n=1 Tax=Alkalibaculum sporogenes TaxID=2655001 RepID=A0A6A7K7I3_9FIRM|nr:DNA repair protein RecN [Alkalibaculum sporogenes]
MLLELNVKNYALIENLNIQFAKGFNVITGETGVGKSIIIDALTMCLGNRASKDIVRKDKEKMIAQALFFIENPSKEVKVFFDRLGIDDVNNIILTREVTSSGKSIARINGIVVNVNDLRQLGTLLVDIHSQREHQSLLDRSKHISIIDNYIGVSLEKPLEELKLILAKYRELINRRDKIIKEEMQMEREKDLLQFQSKELSEITLVQGEDEELESQYKILNNSEMIFTNSNIAYELLYLNEKSVYNELSKSIDYIEKIKKIDEKVTDYLNILNEALLLIEDGAHSIRDYKDEINYNQDELEDLNRKIVKIDNLKKKYGPEIKDILDYKEYVEQRLEIIVNKNEVLSELDKKIDIQKDNYLKIANTISNIRKKNAQIFEKKITKELKDLAMEKAVFKVEQNIDESRFSTMGIDNIEFFIKTNAGEDFKPLVKTASGGELSRIILSIKNIINLSDNIDTLIFDEVDTGISGRSAQTVAKKINNISINTQVVCISHLPQIASMADIHYNVIKESTENETFTIFKKLNINERCIELAKMTSGHELTEKSIDHAREMLILNGKISP